MSIIHGMAEKDLNELAGMLKIESEFRCLFDNAMNLADLRYAVLKDLKFDTKPICKAADNLSNKSRGLISAIKGFDEAFRGFDKLSRNPADELMGVTLCRQKDSLERARSLVVADAEKWRDLADTFSKTIHDGPIKELKDIKERKTYADRLLVNDLLNAYVAGGKNEEPKSLGRKANGECSGPLYEFIVRSREIFGANKKSSVAMGGMINRIMTNRYVGDPIT